LTAHGVPDEDDGHVRELQPLEQGLHVTHVHVHVEPAVAWMLGEAAPEDVKTQRAVPGLVHRVSHGLEPIPVVPDPVDKYDELRCVRRTLEVVVRLSVDLTVEHAAMSPMAVL
jgi:hypothetical protein